MYFRRALEFQEQKKFEKSLPLFGECYGPLTEASRYLSSAYEDEYNVDEDSIEDLQDQVHVTEAAARALQAIHTGDELYKKAVFEAEILDVDLLWGCMDWYQQAIVYSNIYCDLETEAIASCRIGIIYLRVLKMTEKGYSRLKHAFDLAESMKPRYFVNDEWYKQCVAAMQEHQTEKRRKEEEERAKSKAPYLEKLKDELALIRERSEKSPYELLKHVYEKHPPKNDAKLPDEIKPEQLKKTLKHALAHYHPDKNAECNFGMEWSVLAEEISKYISSHYERQKGF